MLRRLALAACLLVLGAPPAHADDADDVAPCTCDATPAACDAGCACDSECEVDWTADECAAPGAGCLTGAVEPDDTTLDAIEMATPEEADPIEWTAAPAQVECATGGTNHDGACVPDPAADPAGRCRVR